MATRPNLRDAPSRDKSTETNPRMVSEIVARMLAAGQLPALDEALKRQVGEAA